jgi:hypothetical protein
MKAGQHHSPTARRRIAERTREAMASPAVHRKISEGTKLGMKARTAVMPELTRLREAWREARPGARRAFLNEVLAPLLCEVRP